jgi:hypothetical protein
MWQYKAFTSVIINLYTLGALGPGVDSRTQRLLLSVVVCAIDVRCSLVCTTSEVASAAQTRVSLM